jgi:hypothetical protein
MLAEQLELDWATSADVSNLYSMVPLAEELQLHAVIYWKKAYYKFVRLPFGFTGSHFIATNYLCLAIADIVRQFLERHVKERKFVERANNPNPAIEQLLNKPEILNRLERVNNALFEFAGKQSPIFSRLNELLASIKKSYSELQHYEIAKNTRLKHHLRKVNPAMM